MQLVQQILVGVVVWLHRNRRAGLLLRADVVAQPLIGKGRVVVPLGGAASRRDAVQRVESLLIKAAADIICRRPQLGVTGGAAVALPPGRAAGAVIAEAEWPEPEAAARKGVLILLAVAVALAVGLPALPVGGAAALLDAHDLTVGGLDLLEMLLRRRVIGVQVGVVLLALLAVGFFNCFVIGTGGDAQYAVWISHGVVPPCACVPARTCSIRRNKSCCTIASLRGVL